MDAPNLLYITDNLDFCIKCDIFHDCEMTELLQTHCDLVYSKFEITIQILKKVEKSHVHNTCRKLEF